MLWAQGIPDLFEIEPFLDVAHRKELWAGITADTVYLFSVRPLALLAKVTRSPTTIVEDGTNHRIFLSESLVIVLTSKGLLHFYDIIRIREGLYQPVYEEHSEYYKTPLIKAIPNKTLRFRLGLELNVTLSTALVLKDDILVCTRGKPCSFVSISPENGELKITGIRSFETLPFIVDPMDEIIQIEADLDLSTFIWITKGGFAYLAIQTIDYEHSDIHATVWEGDCFYTPLNPKRKALIFSFASKTQTLAMALDNGMILVFEKKGSTFVQQHLFEMGTMDYEMTDIALTSTGQCMAIGTKHHGIYVYTKYGYLLFTTLNVGSFSSLTLDAAVFKNADRFFHGSNKLFWGPYDFNLYITASRVPDEKHSCMYTIEFAKYMNSMPSIEKKHLGITLISENYLILFKNELNSPKTDTEIHDRLGSEYIELPISYMAAHWPIQIISMSIDCKDIAIAGKKGLAVYSKKKWKLFGNVQQEESFFVNQSMVWFNDYLIACVEASEETKYEIWAFSKKSNLSLDHLWYSSAVELKVDLFKVWRDSLVTLWESRRLTLYSVEMAGKDKLALQSLWEFDFSLVIPSSAIVEDIFVQSIQDQCFFLFHSQDHLYLLKGNEADTWTPVLLNPLQVYGWYQTLNGETMFWFMDGSLNIKIGLWDFQKGSYEERICLTPEDIDFFPLALDYANGFIYGNEQIISLRNQLYCPIFKLSCRLGLILSQLLKSTLVEPAHVQKIILDYPHTQILIFALERLLYSILSEEMEQSPQVSQLPVVIQVLQCLESTFMDVVVRCARKIEASYWKVLFEHAGDPKEHFMKCLSCNKLDTATSYLVILQTLEPIEKTLEMAQELFISAIATENYLIVKEVKRFLEAPEFGTHSFLSDMLNQHVNQLMENWNFKSIYELQNALSWIEIPLFSELPLFASFFRYLHEHYHWPYPHQQRRYTHDFTEALLSREPEPIVQNPKSGTWRRLSIPVHKPISSTSSQFEMINDTLTPQDINDLSPILSTKARLKHIARQEVVEIRFWMSFFESKMPLVALSFGSLLMDVEFITTLIVKEHVLMEEWKACMLSCDRSGGYLQLVDNVMPLVESTVLSIREALARETKVPIDFDASVDISDAMYS